MSNSNHIPGVIIFSVQLTLWTSGVTVNTVNFTVFSGCILQNFMININFYMHTENILLQHSILKDRHIGSKSWSASISKLEEWKVLKIIWAYPKKIMLCMNWQYSIETQKTHYTNSTTNNHAPRCMMVKLWHVLLLLQNFMGTEWQIWNMKQWPTTASQYWFI